MTDQNTTPRGPGRPPGQPLSERELEQRRAAAALSTGPRTDEGKARSSRNGWKHGMFSAAQSVAFEQGAAGLAKLFGKPCRTTCPVHPDNPERTEAPCGLVLSGMCRAGDSCMDKTVYLGAFAALLDAMETGVMDGMQAQLAREGASALQLIDQLRTEIASSGFQHPQYAINKSGEVVMNPTTGEPLIVGYKVSPLWPVLIGLIEKMGVSLPEMLATPLSRTRAKLNEDAGTALTTILGSLMQRAGQPGVPGVPALEHDVDA